MQRRNSLHDENLKARLARLMNGDLQVEDIAKLYVGKRSTSYGRSSFKEIADFAAHPDTRNRGPVTERIHDMRTTFKPLFDKSLNDENPETKDILARAEANFRMANDAQVVRLSAGLKRQQAHRLLKSAVEKMRNNEINSMTDVERRMLIAFGDRVIWNPALHGQEVFDDFQYVMLKNQLLDKRDRDKLNKLRPLVILHAITVMHGTEIDLGNGISGELQAGYNNMQGFLEVTATPKLKEYPKDVFMKLGLFWTDLIGCEHVATELTKNPGPWEFAIEVKDLLICPIGEAIPMRETPDGRATINIG